MTMQDEAPTTIAVESAAPAPRSRRGRYILVGAIGVLALAGWLTWSAVGQSAVAGTRVVYDAQPVRCDGTEVGLVESPRNVQFLQPVVALTEGMTCELRIQVINGGWSDVTVTTVGVTGMGIDSFLGLEAQMINPSGLAPANAPVEDAAVFDFAADEVLVPAGESATFSVFFGYNGGAPMIECSAQGWNPSVVTVTALGAARDVQPGDEYAIWVRKGTDADCAG